MSHSSSAELQASSARSFTSNMIQPSELLHKISTTPDGNSTVDSLLRGRSQTNLYQIEQVHPHELTHQRESSPRHKTSEGAPNKQKRKRAPATSSPKRSRPRRVTLIDNLGSSHNDKAAAKAGERDTSDIQSPKPPEMEPVQPQAREQATESVEGITPKADTTAPRTNKVDQPHLIEAAITEITRTANPNSTTHVEGEIFCYTALCPEGDMQSICQQLDPLYAFKSTADPDSMYRHEAMRQPDRDQFSEAMQKEYDSRLHEKVYSLERKSNVPKDGTILPTIWQLRRKRDIKTRAIKKYKA